jgi:hypothetical protein
MSIIGSNILAGASGQAAGGYEIEQSLRFNYGEGRLIWTPASSGNRKKFTFSSWCKRTKIGWQEWLFGSGGSSNPREGLNFEFSERLDVASNAGSPPLYNVTSSAVYRDPSAWYHVIYVFDSAQATASDRIRLYVNGARIINLDNTTYPSQNADAQFINSTSQHVVGGQPDDLGLFDGYLAEVIFADGQALDPTDLGEYDSQNVWRPIDPSGITFGGNGFYLKFDPSATNGVGHDHSGNGNNFTANGFDTTNTTAATYDVMSDTPTTNYATYNPLIKFGNQGSFSEGNLASTASGQNSYASIPFFANTTGKYYVEFTANSSSHIAVDGRPVDTYNSGRYIEYQPNGNIVNGGGASGASFTTNDIIGVAIDMDNLTVAFYKNNSLQATVNLSNGSLPGAGFCVGNYSGVNAIHYVNFGQRAFAYTPPTGFNALNTANLPAPDIADGSDYFDTVTYTGDGTTSKTVGNLSFQPDLVWLKSRSQGYRHNMFDPVRGYSNFLEPSFTNAESAMGTSAGTSFFLGSTSSGFTVGQPTSGTYSGNAGTNENGTTFVGWNWLASNTSGSSNTDGSITSTVSANPSAGFSIVSYTGNGTAGATVGHGLGVAPKMVIVKVRNQSYGWIIGHQDIAWTRYLSFDTNAASTLYLWNNTAPTSTVFSVHSDALVNGSSNTYIAYCFAEVEGYSKFGSYVSNNSADGPFCFCGFKPELVWLKKTSGSSNWFMYDAARNEYNVTGNKLYADSSAAENGEDGGSTTSNTIDILSNGFKLRTNNGTNNGGDYIFCAWAQHPFGGEGVSPATAR